MGRSVTFNYYKVKWYVVSNWYSLLYLGLTVCVMSQLTEGKVSILLGGFTDRHWGSKGCIVSFCMCDFFPLFPTEGFSITSSLSNCLKKSPMLRVIMHTLCMHIVTHCETSLEENQHCVVSGMTKMTKLHLYHSQISKYSLGRLHRWSYRNSTKAINRWPKFSIQCYLVIWWKLGDDRKCPKHCLFVFWLHVVYVWVHPYMLI